MRRLISLFEIATVNRPVIERVLGSRINDFEDAVLAETFGVGNRGEQAMFLLPVDWVNLLYMTCYLGIIME